MRISRIIAALAAFGAVLQAQAAAQACVTERELTSLVTFALPGLMDSTIKTCQPHLAANGFFATQGPTLLTRYAGGRNAAWPVAKAAMMKLGGDKDVQTMDMVRSLPDQALQPFAEAMIAQVVSKNIKSDQCVAIERGARLLAPLPPENTAELITFIVSIVDKPKPGKKADLSLCPPKD